MSPISVCGSAHSCRSKRSRSLSKPTHLNIILKTNASAKQAELLR